MTKIELENKDKNIEPLFTVLNDTINYIEKNYARSWNISNSFRNRHFRKITKEKFKQIFYWVKIDNIILLDFINFIEANDDIFPKNRFEIQHLETEDIIKFNLNLPLVYHTSQYSKDLNYLVDMDCSYISLNNRTNIITIKAYHEGIYHTKRFYNNKITLLNNKDIINTYIFKYLINLMYICSMYFIEGNYNKIENIFKIINNNVDIYNNFEED